MMEISFSIRCSQEVNSKVGFITDLKNELNLFLSKKDYGDGLLEILIMLDATDYPTGFEHLRKRFKPKFTDYKVVKGTHTGEQFEIKKQFSYSVNFEDELYNRFATSSAIESKKLLASEIFYSLSNLESLPKKVKDFDREQFKADVEHFFKERNLL